MDQRLSLIALGIGNLAPSRSVDGNKRVHDLDLGVFPPRALL